ncbi:MAG: HD domain-containing protein [Sulfuricellaceae bacterium]|nr:HD domain-containing protein [Sulfuricellaceae bacterium]
MTFTADSPFPDLAMAGQEQSVLLNLQRELDQSIPIGQKLNLIHDAIKRCSTTVHRIAVILYDARTDMLSTFIHSTVGQNPLLNYSVRLSEVASLHEIARHGAPRILNDLAEPSGGEGAHTRQLLKEGYRSSLTYPFYHNDRIQGFLFFNSRHEGVFSGGLLDMLNVFSQVISSLVIKETTLVRTMTAAVRTAQNISRNKNEETGAHLERMAHYSRLLASSLAGSHGLNDEFIEYVHLFAPMHDIGKVSIPDAILLKPGKLTTEEFSVIKSHSTVGRKIIDNMVDEFALDGFPHIQMLRNIVELHHEAMDGSGYPRGLIGVDIPIEARICTVADVFDALTSCRPYKPAWDNAKSFSILRDMSEFKLDRDCVEALISNGEKINEIQAIFCESKFG